MAADAEGAIQVPAVPEPIELLQPDDYHHHLRDEPYLEHTVPFAARAFDRLLVMPNLVPPVTTTEMALAYRERILKRVPEDVPEGSFLPLMTLYLTDNTTPEEIARAKESGHIYAVKLYPAGATTNSSAGVTSYEKIVPALKKMEEVGLLLLVHGESTDQTIDIFEREQAFYSGIMPDIVAKCPSLRIVCEHVTSSAGVAFVEAQGSNIAGTITAHHLLYNRNAIFKGGIQPHYYCLPIPRRRRIGKLYCGWPPPAPSSSLARTLHRTARTVRRRHVVVQAASPPTWPLSWWQRLSKGKASWTHWRISSRHGVLLSTAYRPLRRGELWLARLGEFQIPTTLVRTR